jgi:hypothetical protein
MPSSYRQAHLQGESQRASEVPGLVDGEYDLLVMTSSWDSRCLCLLDADIRATAGIGVYFENRGKLGLRDVHDPKVHAYLETHCRELDEFTKPSEALDDLWGALWLATCKAYARIKRPLHVLLDLSTCPRYYAMAFLAQGMRQGVLASLTCLYAEGEYPPPSVEDPGEEFTAGRWETRSVPMLVGTADPGNKRLYVVSVGFEGPKTFRAVSSDDPDRVVVLFPDPGVRAEYPQRTRDKNDLLFKEFGIDESRVLRAPAGDAIDAWRCLNEANVAREDENPFYLCSGTKPHALAMAIHGLLTDRPTVLYAKPVGHKETQILPLGVYWSFRIEDLAMPTRA